MNAYATRARVVLLAALAVAAAAAPALAAEPAGEVTVSFHVTLAPAWFDPSTAPPQITPFGVMYAIHDALVRPLPNQKMGASLAESWTESRDGLVYEFKLRRGLKFHNGDPLSAEDVKFSFDRYNGAGARELRARVRQLEIVDPLTVRFTLKEPWPDFMTFYGTTATAAGIVLPKKYFESVGPDGFKQKPIGAGPYRFLSQRPGLEIVLEANTAHWRHAPYIRQLTLKSVPDSTTRLAMLKSGETDFALFLDGPDAGEFTPIPGFSTVGESALNNLNAVGIRVRMRLMERASFYAAWQEKKLRGLFLTAVGNSGNAATRVETFMYSKGPYAYGGYPDLDEMFLQLSRERDPVKRAAILHRIQQLTIDRVMYAPIMDLRGLIGIGPRLSEHTMNVIPMYSFPSYEDMRLKAQ